MCIYDFKKSTQKGLTLAEIVVVVGILGLIMVVVTAFQKNIITNNKYANDSLSSAQDARIILRTMTRELRATSPGSNGAYAIAQAATNTLTFFSDTDNDGLKEQIRYFIATSTNTLRRGSIKPTGSPSVYSAASEIFSTMAYNMKNGTSTALFEYFDTTYAGTSSPLAQPVTVTAIHLVRINLMIDADANKSPIPRIYTSQVNLRNLKDNL